MTTTGEDWIALTKDDALRCDRTDALTAARLRVFALNNASLTGTQMAERYRMHLNRIIQRAATPGPYVDVVTATGLELRWADARGVILTGRAAAVVRAPGASARRWVSATRTSDRDVRPEARSRSARS